MAPSIEWELFTIFGAILIYHGYTLKNPNEKMLRFGVAFIFWIASLSQWITDGGGYVPMLAMIAPTMMSLIWTLQSLAQVTDKPLKANIYE